MAYRIVLVKYINLPINPNGKKSLTSNVYQYAISEELVAKSPYTNSIMCNTLFEEQIADDFPFRLEIAVNGNWKGSPVAISISERRKGDLESDWNGSVITDLRITNLITIPPINVEAREWNIPNNSDYCISIDTKPKENNMFKNMFKNIKFGKVTDNSVVMSIYGPAFKTQDGNYIAYSPTDEYIDATGFIFEGMDNFCFNLPVGEDYVEIGDFILHNNKYCRIIDLDDRGNYVVEDVFNREVKSIMSSRSPFGFNFYTKLVSFGSEIFSPTEKDPFGAMLPMMLMGSDQKSNDNLMLMMMMMANSGTEINPMMIYLLSNKSSSSDDLLPMLMMMNTEGNIFNLKSKKPSKDEQKEDDFDKYII